MRLLKTLTPALALAGLAACATSPQAPNPKPMADAGAPAPIANYDWHISLEPQEAGLAYGVANSDEVKLQLRCATGSGALDLAALLDKPARQLHLESGGDTERYPAVSEDAGITDGAYAEAAAKTRDPVFQRFRRLGWIAVWDGETRRTYAAHPQSLADIERFFVACK
ncbi:hypothetical protein [Brevundimonas sp. SL130]|uniref:hypothetical protein n=1 Tax=Brevundimonas sp. SL130 TaxID=2995143 RepID=UPI00226C6912|nr:hypothetical protein [Brevundimonas sp. SL130]WAC59197.1 hypothetical protein OU998_13360 [Brevundimonas sp. SL130]